MYMKIEPSQIWGENFMYIAQAYDSRVSAKKRLLAL